MTGPGGVREDRQAFDADPLVGLQEIGPDDALDEADLEGIADIEAGRVISHEAVMAWLTDYISGVKRSPPHVGD